MLAFMSTNKKQQLANKQVQGDVNKQLQPKIASLHLQLRLFYFHEKLPLIYLKKDLLHVLTS